MGKKSGRKAKPAVEDLSRPTHWRLQHGEFGAPGRLLDPVSGTPVTHRRAKDLLGKLTENGTIDPVMRDAGEQFHMQFRGAALAGIGTSKLVWVAPSTGDSMTDHIVSSRRRVIRAIDVLGGIDSIGGTCAWHVIGEEMSIREWAMRQGWRGRPVHHVHAQGVLVTVLGVLVGHYRLMKATREVGVTLDDQTPHLVEGDQRRE